MISFYPWQLDAWSRIEGQSAVLAAPTGSGKTLVAYLWAGLLDREGQTHRPEERVIFTAPIKALSNERYLDLRRRTATAIIQRGQKDGTITAEVAAGDLYDRIYGTLFYRFLFGFRPLSADYARKLVASLLAPR